MGALIIRNRGEAMFVNDTEFSSCLEAEIVKYKEFIKECKKALNEANDDLDAIYKIGDHVNKENKDELLRFINKFIKEEFKSITNVSEIWEKLDDKVKSHTVFRAYKAFLELREND